MFTNHLQDEPSKSSTISKKHHHISSRDPGGGGGGGTKASGGHGGQPQQQQQVNQKLNQKIKSGELSFVPVKSSATNNPRKSPPSSSSSSTNNPSAAISTRPIKRIKPTKLSDQVTIVKRQKTNDISDDDDDEASFNKYYKTEDDELSNRLSGGDESMNTVEEEAAAAATTAATKDLSKRDEEKTPITEAFATLLAACRQADPSDDMELLIQKKLQRYYQTVHPDFVNSKSFSKTALGVAADIKANPSLVYLKLTGILEELSIRRKSGQTVVSNEEVAATGTGNARKDYQIKRLNQALYVLKKKIARLDEAEVDLADECNSTFLLVERLKKRACEIYEKICDITGESKHAYRSVRKPITFQGTSYRQFNKTIESFVNRTGIFPDLFDVLRCLEHCNTQYDFKLDKDEVKRIG